MLPCWLLEIAAPAHMELRGRGGHELRSTPDEVLGQGRAICFLPKLPRADGILGLQGRIQVSPVIRQRDRDQAAQRSQR